MRSREAFVLVFGSLFFVRAAAPIPRFSQVGRFERHAVFYSHPNPSVRGGPDPFERLLNDRPNTLK